MTESPESAGGRTPSRVSVIIPVLNAEATIRDQLDALTRQTFNGSWEIVVSDNGSIDGTMAVLQEYQSSIDWLRVLDASTKRGASYARNTGALHAEGDFLAFCDADDVVSSEWLEDLVSAAYTADLVAGPLVPIRSSARGCQNQDEGRVPSSLPRPFDHLPAGPSGNFGIWTSVFADLSGFAEDLTSGEDWDLSWRAQRAGYVLEFAKGALVYRRERRTLRATSTQYFRWGYGTVELGNRHPGVIDTSFGAFASRIVWAVTRFPYLFLSARRRRVWVRGASFSAGILTAVVRNR